MLCGEDGYIRFDPLQGVLTVITGMVLVMEKIALSFDPLQGVLTVITVPFSKPYVVRLVDA